MDGSQGPHRLTQTQYLAIEDQLLSTAQGRTFLRMRDHRTAVIAQDRFQVALNSVKDWMTAAADKVAEDAQLSVLRKELMEMAASIRKTKVEVANIKPLEDGMQSVRRIDTATAELDAIVQATERATTEILGGAEHIMEVAGRVRAAGLADEADSLDNESTNILMACGFQDITGQRIAKVVATLRYLEERVESMIRVWGSDDENTPAPASIPDRMRDSRPDAHLLNGPALDGGIAQADVDAMFEIEVAAEPAAALDQSAIDSLFP